MTVSGAVSVSSLFIVLCKTVGTNFASISKILCANCSSVLYSGDPGRKDRLLEHSRRGCPLEKHFKRTRWYLNRLHIKLREHDWAERTESILVMEGGHARLLRGPQTKTDSSYVVVVVVEGGR